MSCWNNGCGDNGLWVMILMCALFVGCGGVGMLNSNSCNSCNNCNCGSCGNCGGCGCNNGCC